MAIHMAAGVARESFHSAIQHDESSAALAVCEDGKLLRNLFTNTFMIISDASVHAYDDRQGRMWSEFSQEMNLIHATLCAIRLTSHSFIKTDPVQRLLSVASSKKNENFYLSFLCFCE